MSILFLRVDITDNSLTAIPIRAMREIGRTANRKTCMFWVVEYLPGHFEPGADTKYGYKPRSSKYQRAKERQAARKGPTRRQVRKGGKVDLVYSGLMERIMTRQRPSIRAYPTRAVADIVGPSYISLRPKDPDHPHKAAEVTATIRPEVDAIAEFFGRVSTRLIDEHHANKKTTIKG